MKVFVLCSATGSDIPDCSVHKTLRSAAESARLAPEPTDDLFDDLIYYDKEEDTVYTIEECEVED